MPANQIVPRVRPGIPEGGQFDVHTRREAVTTLETTMNEIPCPLCGVSRARATDHRCAAPNLLTLSPATQEVLNAITAAGGHPYIVGGAVRDALLPQLREDFTDAVASKDIDIEVHDIDSADLLVPSLEKIGAVDFRGVSFGVLTVLVDGEDFDVSLPRRDSKTGDGHTDFDVVVDPTLDVVDAFGRRDATINALGWDHTTGELLDPFGGLADIRDGILRHPTEAFTDDALRVIRLVQFSARFGFTIAPETAELCASIHDNFHALPKERVWGEFDKMFTKGRSLTHALNALHQTGWESHFPELAATRGVQQDPTWHPEGDVITHLGLAADAAVAIADRENLDVAARRLVVLSALVHDFGKATHTVTTDGRLTSAGHAEAGVELTAKFLSDIGAPHDLTKKVTTLVGEHMCHISGKQNPSKTQVRRLLRRLDTGNGGPTIQDWALVVEADQSGRGPGNKLTPGPAWVEIANALPTGPEAGPAILKGPMLIAGGIRPGIGMARVVSASVEAQDEGLIESEADAEKWLAQFIADGHYDRVYAEEMDLLRQYQAEKKAKAAAAKAEAKAIRQAAHLEYQANREREKQLRNS